MLVLWILVFVFHGLLKLVGLLFRLGWLGCSYKLIEMLSLCVSVYMDVNHDDTNCNRCTQRLVILRAQIH